jgi:hypothetical protein
MTLIGTSILRPYLRGWLRVLLLRRIGLDACGGWVKEQHLRSPKGSRTSAAPATGNLLQLMRSTTTDCYEDPVRCQHV